MSGTIHPEPASISSCVTTCLSRYQKILEDLNGFEDISYLQTSMPAAPSQSRDPTIATTSNEKQELYWRDTPVDSLIEDQWARFNLWASNIGVFAPIRLSLDYRLRESPDIRQIVFRLVESLLGNLERLNILIESCNSKYEDEDLSMDSPVKTENHPCLRIRPSVHKLADIITRLNRLSNTIRRTGNEARNKRAADFPWNDENGHDQGLAWKNLFAIELIHRKYPDTSEVIRDRLASAMLLRRKRILYRQAHSQKLARNIAPVYPTIPHTKRPTSVPPIALSATASLQQPSVGVLAPIPPLESLGSAATPIARGKFQEIKAPSRISSARSLPIEDETKNMFPPEPEITAGEMDVLCPYCGFILPVEEVNTSQRWKKHVLKDIDPYVCLFEECKQSDRLYDDEKDWLSHMKSEHRVQWKCSARMHSKKNPAIFQDSQDLETHLRETHQGTFTESQLPFLVESCAFVVSPIFESCPIPGPLCPTDDLSGSSSAERFSPRALEKHVLNHLIYLALRSLPVPEDDQDCQDEIAKSDSNSTGSTRRRSNDALGSEAWTDRGFEPSLKTTAPLRELPSLEMYTVGWVATRENERVAARALLDEKYRKPKGFKKHPKDYNEYIWGRIGEHHVVIANLPSRRFGQMSMTISLWSMISSLPHLRFGLLVGIGAGVPRMEEGINIRLGDVVVGCPTTESPGVVQYDIRKLESNGKFERVDFLDSPPEVLLKGLATLKACHKKYGSRVPKILERMFEEYPRLGQDSPDGFRNPGAQYDQLFETFRPLQTTTTADDVTGSRGTLSACPSPPHERERPDPPSDVPKIHYGTIASVDYMVKDGITRDEILKRIGDECICVEMEAAGLLNDFPCLIIRGVCDYADEHKNDRWQNYAAATAAAFTKELLEVLDSKDIENTSKIDDLFNRELSDRHYEMRMAQNETNSMIQSRGNH